MRTVLGTAALAATLVGCAAGVPIPATAAPSATGTAVAVASYADDATGVAFRVPAKLYVSSATRQPDGTTNQAVFKTWDRDGDFKPDADLVFRAYVVKRGAGEDIREFALRNLVGEVRREVPVPRLRGLRIDGNFHPVGQVATLLVPRGTDLVLIFQSFPTTSAGSGLFDLALETLEVR
jgi:hypothetical protein